MCHASIHISRAPQTKAHFTASEQHAIKDVFHFVAVIEAVKLLLELVTAFDGTPFFGHYPKRITILCTLYTNRT